MEENLFKGQLNTSQVLSKTPGKADLLSAVMSSILRIHMGSHASWEKKKKKNMHEEFGKLTPIACKDMKAPQK